MDVALSLACSRIKVVHESGRQIERHQENALLDGEPFVEKKGVIGDDNTFLRL